VQRLVFSFAPICNFPVLIILCKLYYNIYYQCIFISDGIDGKQARRTKSSSPLGELFDHGLDSWASLFIPIAMYSIYGRGEFGVNVFRVYLVSIGVMFCFILSHWEKYITGVLFLPWGYDLSQLVSMQFLSFIFSRFLDTKKNHV
jgi:phosphatidylglycerophosphate synthase